MNTAQHALRAERLALTTRGVAKVEVLDPTTRQVLDEHWRAAAEALLIGWEEDLAEFVGVQVAGHLLVASTEALVNECIRWVV